VEDPGWEIVVLDKLTYAGNLGNLAPVQERITFQQGDITNSDDVHAAMAGVDAVINFAAESHVDRSLLDARPFIRTNIEGVLVLLEEARRAGVQRFLQVSTDEIYGDLAGTDRHSLETDVPAPRSPYAASKTGAEHLVFSYGISYGLNVVITRGSNTYGRINIRKKLSHSSSPTRSTTSHYRSTVTARRCATTCT
jgi:dTDP-glucose 4,6-dehydratase